MAKRKLTFTPKNSGFIGISSNYFRKLIGKIGHFNSQQKGK
jgi:hypothetical protein